MGGISWEYFYKGFQLLLNSPQGHGMGFYSVPGIGADGDVGLSLLESGHPVLLVRIRGEIDSGPIVKKRLVNLKVGVLRFTIEGNTETNYMFVELLESAFLRQFSYFCEDCVKSFGAVGNSLDSDLLAVLSRWNQFWATRKIDKSSVAEVAGLFGELFILQKLLSLGLANVSSWVGPLSDSVDFRIRKIGVEVKATMRRDNWVKISRLDQLDERNFDHLFLAHLKLRAVPTGKTVADVFELLASSLNADDADFLRNQVSKGTVDCFSDYSNEFHFEFENLLWFEVIHGFPRLVASCLKDELPIGIGKIRYDLNLDAAEQFILGEDRVCEILRRH